MKCSFTARVLAGITALGLFSTPALAQGGTGGNAGPYDHTTVIPPATFPGEAPSSNFILGTANGGNDGVLMTFSPFSSTVLPGLFSNMSGLTNLPGTAIFSMSGGMTNGGNLFHFLANGTLFGPLPTGFSSVPGLAWVKSAAGTELVGSAAVSIIGDGLIKINAATGASTTSGTYGSGIGGIDAIAQDPTSGVLYGSTGFFYDGSPGDKITINIATGLATDTFTDMSPLPPCTVGGMSFDLSGQGYISIGCGGPGGVYTWNVATNAIALIGTGSAGSMTDIQAVF